MTNAITIRPMKACDIEAVFEIERLCFSTPWSKNAFLDEIESNICARYMVAVQGGNVIAYGGMWLIINEAHITNIAVQPFYRKQKVATKLLHTLMTIAHDELAIKKMTLEVRKSNYRAQALYRKYGFLVAGERKQYYDDKEDATIMWCDDITLSLKKASVCK